MKLDSNPWQSIPKISLREAAKNANPSNAFYGTSCNCKTGCHGKNAPAIKMESLARYDVTPEFPASTSQTQQLFLQQSMKMRKNTFRFV